MTAPRLRQIALAVLRSYVRYTPWSFGKQFLWVRIIAPYFAWRDHQFAVRTRFGALLAGNTQDMLQQYIYFFGQWEPGLTQYMAKRLSSGDVMVDVGANIGYFTLHASRLVGETGRVVAIEASPRIFRDLERNIERNAATNVRTVNAAVADSVGTRAIFLGDESSLGHSSIFPEPGLQLEAEVPAAPLTSILSEDESRRVCFVKIDVEGAEALVVAGMMPLLTEGRPDLEVMVEIGPDRLEHHGATASELVSLFEALGFRAYALPNDYSPWPYLLRSAGGRPQLITGPIVSETDVIFSRLELDSDP